MENEIIERAIIDPNLDSYKSFFDHEWCERTFTSVATSRLKNPVDTLMSAWRRTDGIHRLPWVMVDQLRGYAEGEVGASLRYRTRYHTNVVQGLCEKLEAWTPSLDSEQRREQRRAVVRIEESSNQALKTAKSHVPFYVSGYWDRMIGNFEFCVSILGAQRLTYPSLFFAYEDFLASTIKAKKDPNYSSKGRNIGLDLKSFSYDTLAAYCWNDAEVDLARLVRHAVAHNSGRLGAELEKYKVRFVDVTDKNTAVLKGDQFNVINDMIQITPGNTAYLFGVLKDRVTKVVEVAR